MRMIVGGSSQGKLNCLLGEGTFTEEDVCWGSCCTWEEPFQKPVLYQFHLLVRRLLEAGLSPEEFCSRFIAENKDAVVIADEIGCGIVPINAFERQWREETGRRCCQLAAYAQRVDRVFCGCLTHIKGA